VVTRHPIGEAPEVPTRPWRRQGARYRWPADRAGVGMARVSTCTPLRLGRRPRRMARMKLHERPPNEKPEPSRVESCVGIPA